MKARATRLPSSSPRPTPTIVVTMSNTDARMTTVHRTASDSESERIGRQTSGGSLSAGIP